ncbi:MAG: glycosyltransferase family 39 protein [Phycisphaerales bacterium]|nr:MAG: glycosyltransferase family 39 protein [Phycisphaerales bacterium]
MSALQDQDDGEPQQGGVVRAALRPVRNRTAETPLDTGQDVHSSLDSHASARMRWVIVFVVCLAVWLIARMVFFVGIAGSDDLYYFRYAALWDRPPVNDWEARLLGNVLTRGAMAAFGRTELAAVLPSLAASALMLASVLYWCRNHGTLRQAWWGGVFLAVLPIDVEMATTISPHTIMAALMGAGTLAFLYQPATRTTRFLSALFLSLGVITHFAGIYYVAALALASLCVDHRRYSRTVVLTLAVGIVLTIADLAVFHFAFGDAFGRFRVCLAEVNTDKPGMLMTGHGTLNPGFILWPVVHLPFSKAFGASLLAVVILGVRRYRRVDPRLRILLTVIAVFWIWMSFGSQIPWEYRPFLRMSRFLQPLTFAVAVLFATLVVDTHWRRLSAAFTGAVLATCVFCLLAGGSWGENVTISKELLTYVASYPEKRFVTDYHTHNEVYVINGATAVPNIVTINHVPRSRLLDPDVAMIDPSELQPDDEILCNPLNVARVPQFAEFTDKHAAGLRFETKPAYRDICRIVPPLRQHPWALRKPPARVFACNPVSQSRRLTQRIESTFATSSAKPAG